MRTHRENKGSMFCRRRPDHQDHGFQHSFSNHSPYWCHCHCGLSGFRFSGGRNSTECGRNSGVQSLRPARSRRILFSRPVKNIWSCGTTGGQGVAGTNRE
ncbi:hypothetical protein RSAG8_05598, partial [Rhizoctonia solani AG-8 WAC10335]